MACVGGLQGLHELMHSAPHTGPSMSYFLSASLLLEREETDTGPRERGSIFTEATKSCFLAGPTLLGLSQLHV